MPKHALMSDNVPVTIDQTLAAPQQFTRDAQADFLDALSNWGNVGAAARYAGVGRTTVYRMRRACPRFRRLWDAAPVLARPQVEAVLADRALNGVEEQVFYHGEEVALRRRYDARLLLAHLGRLDRMARTREVNDACVGFDQAIEDLLSEPEIEFVGTVTPDQGGRPCEDGRDG